VPKGIYSRLIALVFAAAGLLPGAWAQEGGVSFPANPRYTVQRLDEQYGLGVVTATAMGQDAQGFLWIGTQTGLYRYDGARAKKMTEVENLTGHYILDLLIAPDGTAWFAGSRGIAHYKDGKFEKLAIPESAMPLGIGSQIFAVDSEGMVYVVMFKQGILRIDPRKTAEAVILGTGEREVENAAGIARGADDSIWFTYGTQLAHIARGTTTIEVDPRIQLPKERVVALVFDGDGALWLRTVARLGRIEPRLHKISFESAGIGTAHEEEGKPSLDRQGRLLVPSSAGLFWQEGKHWRVLTAQQGIASNNVQSALEDREGTLWVAGSGTGLDRLPGVHDWSAWTTTEGLPDNATWSTLRDHQGRLWVSTGRGIGIWDGQTQRWGRVPTLQGQTKDEIRQMQLAGDGSVWALTATGALLRIDARSFNTTTTPSYHGRSFVSILTAPDGSVWATARAHLLRFEPRKATPAPVEIPLPGQITNDIEFLSFAPSGVLWASGPGAVYRYDGKRWKTIGTEDGLRGQTITSVVAVNDNEAWIAYNDVVSVTHILLDAKGTPHFEGHYWDWSIVARDSKNRIWFNGTDGIAVLSPDGRVQRMSHADGLIWDDISPWTGVREEADGSFVIATSRGLARYQPSIRAPTGSRASVVLTSIMLGGEGRRMTDVPEVASSVGTLAVEFSPLVLDTPERISCVYKLNGLEQQATETQLREVQYGGLPPGKYEFWVKCQKPNSGAEPTQARFRFRVLPSIWQTWWAKAAGGVLLLLGLWVFVAQRTRALNRRRLELEQAVAQRNAELLQKNKELEEISLTDPLTGTRNRRYFYETISTDVAQALRSHLRSPDSDAPSAPKQELIFVLVDIDRFKRVNDEMGHAAGDRLLQEVAKRIASVMRRSDDLVRWGGEEFLLVCRTTDRENAGLLCNRVLEAIRELPFDVGNGVRIHKTCSIGWAPFPWLRDDVGLLSIDNVIELADKALYLAKREGRNRSFGMVPAAAIEKSEKSVTMERLRDCPPELVQIV
jgi:diguanylate cyclase (GGDEF)-like protein